MPKSGNKVITRGEEIAKTYFDFLDAHITDVVEGNVVDFMELNQIASELAISHQHLSDTIQKETGNHPCHFYDLKIIEQAKRFLSETDWSVAEVARTLTYDPSNFSKFFKKFVGQTPMLWRNNVRGNSELPKSSPY